MEKLKDNEILIFTDFNNTLVDYANEFDFRSEIYDDFEGFLRHTKNGVTKALKTFETETGLTPVVCIITNSKLSNVDKNGYNGICYDLKMTFFNHDNMKDEIANYEANNTCEKYIKYVMHKENEGYIKINPLGRGMYDTFTMHCFDDDTLNITSSFVKQESVMRMIHELGLGNGKYAIFAGDSIQDDYPMKYAITDSGVRKIFIRPGRVTKMKPSIKQQFCNAKGVVFDCVNPRTNKKIKILDEQSLAYLTPEQLEWLENYSDGDTILLTNPNSRGFIEGIYRSAEIIKGLVESGKEKGKDI